MPTAWLVVQAVLGVLGSILVWAGIAGAVTNLRDRRRARLARPSTRPPAGP